MCKVWRDEHLFLQNVLENLPAIFLNRLIVDRITAVSLVSSFSGTQCIYASQLLHTE